MPLVRHNGFAIAVDHPAMWVDGGEQIVRDLVEIMPHRWITGDCLRHLSQNHDRPSAAQYDSPDGRRCLMFLLSEPLGERQICCKQELTRFFGREQGIAGLPGYVPARQSPEYQPAKCLV